MFQTHTIAEQAELVRQLREEGTHALEDSNDMSQQPIVPVPRDGALPLSFAQQRLWILDRIEGSNPAYHMPVVFRLAGDLQLDLMERVFDHIIQRHETLRTRFPEVDGKPTQIIDAHTPFQLQPLDLSQLPEDERKVRQRDHIAHAVSDPFDLENGPLYRFVVDADAGGAAEFSLFCARACVEPRHIVATQLNTFTPVGTAISMVAYIKYSSPAMGIPTVNIWCAQTMNDRKAIAEVAYTMEL